MEILQTWVRCFPQRVHGEMLRLRCSAKDVQSVILFIVFFFYMDYMLVENLYLYVLASNEHDKGAAFSNIPYLPFLFCKFPKNGLFSQPTSAVLPSRLRVDVAALPSTGAGHTGPLSGHCCKL